MSAGQVELSDLECTAAGRERTLLLKPAASGTGSALKGSRVRKSAKARTQELQLPRESSSALGTGRLRAVRELGLGLREFPTDFTSGNGVYARNA